MRRFPKKSRGKVRRGRVQEDETGQRSTTRDRERNSDEALSQRGVQLQHENFFCPICLELLKRPVTTPCGHNFCLDCIKTYWDGMTIYSCPQCRKTFTPRPELMKNTMLADLVEELKKTEVHAAPADHCYAGAEDVACDVCTGRKYKALKSCLVCLASYCEEHLQPHHQSPPFKKHKLVEPSKNLQENICPLHDEVMKMFCRTDQQCICYLCSVEEHKDHNAVSAAAERTLRQRELELSLQQRLQDREEDEKVLHQELVALNVSADKAEEDSERIFTEMIQLLQRRSSDVKQKIRSKRETEVSRIKDVQEKLQQEITELKRGDPKLKQLSLTHNHAHFLLNYRSLSALSPSAHSSTINIQPQRYFDDMMAAVAKGRAQLQDVLTDTWANISRIETRVDDLLPQPEPKTRAEFLRYSQDITLDPNTAHRCLSLSEGNRKVKFMERDHSYPGHADRFTDVRQVMSRESLTERCYWEMEWDGLIGVNVALTYKNIGRAGRSEQCDFGNNDKSWALVCFHHGCTFIHRRVKMEVSRGWSSRVGVYLDHRAGLLSFYRVCDTMTLLHRIHTTFTQPLHAGVTLHLPGDRAHFCPLKFHEQDF
ncbi:tripartite motif-containing protein 16-like [Solea solea]|uniref:tripartite motif-containing protein 16-like n=1 Tax=Solea solea TaxID=90069 RepID=UPI00272CD430|nr:tripartite motif-containing protein 16-like [Solea solea]XP_058483269.1 tripartite motif-containing protein 16-like [Solea solea]XP_058483280.1 tripartite motif-containing protein 16-like [Solea solea]